MSPLFAIFGFGPMEMVVIAVIGILLFGRKLPEISKYLGKSIIEFKKGMKGLEDNLDDYHGGANAQPMAHPTAPSEAIRPPQRVAATAPKFEDAPANTHVTSTPPQV
jgi:sec-independent protein translocase protein TatA